MHPKYDARAGVPDGKFLVGEELYRHVHDSWADQSEVGAVVEHEVQFAVVGNERPGERVLLVIIRITW